MRYLPAVRAHQVKPFTRVLKEDGMGGLFVGLITYFIVIGPERLIPSNLTWLANGGWDDSWQHYLGWVTYRNSPWELPMGANSSYGIGYTNSVVFTDSIPLFALFFKLLSPFLPAVFQYFGIWLLLCFSLQGFIAWKIIRIFSSDLVFLTCGTLCIVFLPITLHRINTHLALVGQFAILFGLYLCFRQKPNKHFLCWTLLLGITSGIHSYLLVMNLVLFIADTVQRLIRKSISLRISLMRIPFLILSLLLVMWQFGYFVIKGGLSTIFPSRLFKMDLLQPFNVSGWSLIFSGKYPRELGNFEGFNYFGLGILILLLISSFLSMINRRFWSTLKKKYSPLVIVIIVMTLYSLSNEVTLGKKILFRFDYPNLLEFIPGVLRAVGRFFWVPAFCAVFASLYFISRTFSNKFAVPLVVLLTTIQLVDTSFGWRQIQSITKLSPGYGIPLYDIKLWSDFRKRYKAIRVLPTYSPDLSCDWRQIGYIAATLNFKTNCAQSARTDRLALRKDYEDFMQEIQTSTLRKDSVYILSIPFFENYQESINKANATFKLIPGYYLILPNLESS
jgi:hypothetical protein